MDEEREVLVTLLVQYVHFDVVLPLAVEHLQENNEDDLCYFVVVEEDDPEEFVLLEIHYRPHHRLPHNLQFHDHHLHIHC